jgi:hypothetical protein
VDVRQVAVKLDRKYQTDFGTCFCGEVLPAESPAGITYVNFVHQRGQDKAKWITDVLAQVKICFPDAQVILHPDSLVPHA